MKKKLKWGETPWDNMTKEQLLREVQRMFSAVDSANYVLKSCNDGSTFWSNHGVGGKAIEKVEQVTNSVYQRYDSESVFRSFYRYADDLLFDTSKHTMLGSGWAVCPVCKNMFGWNRQHEQNKSPFGQKCGEYSGFSGDCKGILRKLTWRDMKPEA